MKLVSRVCEKCGWGIPADAPEGGGNAIRNPGWKNGIWVGSAKDGSIKYFIEGTRPEGLAADDPNTHPRVCPVPAASAQLRH